MLNNLKKIKRTSSFSKTSFKKNQLFNLPSLTKKSRFVLTKTTKDVFTEGIPLVMLFSLRKTTEFRKVIAGFAKKKFKYISFRKYKKNLKSKKLKILKKIKKKKKWAKSFPNSLGYFYLTSKRLSQHFIFKRIKSKKIYKKNILCFKNNILEYYFFKRIVKKLSFNKWLLHFNKFQVYSFISKQKKMFRRLRSKYFILNNKNLSIKLYKSYSKFLDYRSLKLSKHSFFRKIFNTRFTGSSQPIKYEVNLFSIKGLLKKINTVIPNRFIMYNWKKLEKWNKKYKNYSKYRIRKKRFIISKQRRWRKRLRIVKKYKCIKLKHRYKKFIFWDRLNSTKWYNNIVFNFDHLKTRKKVLESEIFVKKKRFKFYSLQQKCPFYSVWIYPNTYKNLLIYGQNKSNLKKVFKKTKIRKPFLLKLFIKFKTNLYFKKILLNLIKISNKSIFARINFKVFTILIKLLEILKNKNINNSLFINKILFTILINFLIPKKKKKLRNFASEILYKKGTLFYISKSFKSNIKPKDRYYHGIHKRLRWLITVPGSQKILDEQNFEKKKNLFKKNLFKKKF